MNRVRLRGILAAAALTLGLAAPAFAVSDPSEMLPNPAQERRAEHIGDQLRCMVCQNESIETSEADLARDLRHIVRQRVVAGDTDAQVMAWMQQRYGDFVRLRPPFRPLTWALWFSPVLAVLAAGAVALMAARRSRAPAAPLSEAEQARLRELMKS
jgi:cytochrome c-type biogenesis protein CcmH